MCIFSKIEYWKLSSEKQIMNWFHTLLSAPQEIYHVPNVIYKKVCGDELSAVVRNAEMWP